MAVKRKSRHSRPPILRSVAEANIFADLRIRWIDRLDRALGEHPGAPPGTDLAFSVTKMRTQLRDYREGFVAGLRVAGRKL